MYHNSGHKPVNAAAGLLRTIPYIWSSSTLRTKLIGGQTEHDHRQLNFEATYPEFGPTSADVAYRLDIPLVDPQNDFGISDARPTTACRSINNTLRLCLVTVRREC